MRTHRAVYLWAIAMSALGLMLMSFPTTATAGADPETLFGPRYESTKVTVDGKPKRLFDETQIRVDFDHASNGDALAFRAACNHFGASVSVDERRIAVREIVGTEIGCPGASARQDRWLARFFGSDPRWHVPEPDKLKLVSGHRVIKLER